MSAAFEILSAVTIEVAPANNENEGMPWAGGAAIMLAAAALVSWLASLILNWRLAPRWHKTRIAFAGALPVAILFGLLITISVLIEGKSIWFVLNILVNLPTRGRVLMGSMLAMGLLAAWLTATFRRLRDVRKAAADVDAFR